MWLNETPFQILQYPVQTQMFNWFYCIILRTCVVKLFLAYMNMTYLYNLWQRSWVAMFVRVYSVFMPSLDQTRLENSLVFQSWLVGTLTWLHHKTFENLGRMLNEETEENLTNFMLELYMKQRSKFETTPWALRWHMFLIHQSELNRLPVTHKAFTQCWCMLISLHCNENHHTYHHLNYLIQMNMVGIGLRPRKYLSQQWQQIHLLQTQLWN